MKIKRIEFYNDKTTGGCGELVIFMETRNINYKHTDMVFDRDMLTLFNIFFMGIRRHWRDNIVE